MRVYRINDENFWAGEDLESIKAAYLEETGEAVIEWQEVRDLSKQMIIDTDDNNLRATAAEFLTILQERGEKFPLLLAYD